MPTKPFDIILIGATGFTGERAVRYLNEHVPEHLKWGIAARNPKKMAKTAEKLSISSDRCFIVDTTVKEEVEAVAEQTRIVITTVGPFSLYGEEVIAACAKYGTHYLDITGEVGFIKEMKNKYGNLAEKNGAKIIPFSGFDSVPADIASFLLSKSFNSPKQLNIKAYYSISGGFNGGTIATMLNKFESGEYKKMSNSRLLIENHEQKVHSPESVNFFGYDKRIARWSAPFIMGAINSKVVFNTAALMKESGNGYAESISYSEHSSLGRWYNPIPFLVVSAVLLSITMLGPKKWFRSLLKKFMPAPGEGPSEKQIEHGYFKMKAFAKDENGKQQSIHMSYPGDPGNKATVFFLCESALCLAELEQELSDKTGFLTPISAFGGSLVKRLREKGLQMELNP